MGTFERHVFTWKSTKFDIQQVAWDHNRWYRMLMTTWSKLSGSGAVKLNDRRHFPRISKKLSSNYRRSSMTLVHVRYSAGLYVSIWSSHIHRFFVVLDLQHPAQTSLMRHSPASWFDFLDTYLKQNETKFKDLKPLKQEKNLFTFTICSKVPFVLVYYWSVYVRLGNHFEPPDRYRIALVLLPWWRCGIWCFFIMRLHHPSSFVDSPIQIAGDSGAIQDAAGNTDTFQFYFWSRNAGTK